MLLVAAGLIVDMTLALGRVSKHERHIEEEAIERLRH